MCRIGFFEPDPDVNGGKSGFTGSGSRCLATPTIRRLNYRSNASVLRMRLILNLIYVHRRNGNEIVWNFNANYKSVVNYQ